MSNQELRFCFAFGNRFTFSIGDFLGINLQSYNTKQRNGTQYLSLHEILKNSIIHREIGNVNLTILYRSLLISALTAASQASEKILEVYSGKRMKIRLKRDLSPVTLADQLAHEVIVQQLKVTEIPVLSEEGIKIPFEVRSSWERFWLVDPLDGTKEFIKRNDEFTVNIALVEGQRPVLGVILAPVTGDCWFAAPGIGARFITGLIPGDGEDLIGRSVSLPLPHQHRPYRVIASRSHLNAETSAYIQKKTRGISDVESVNRGSSLKLCMIAEGSADLYPRFAPTMEWDTAAGDAIVTLAGGKIVMAKNDQLLLYNKPDLLNPWFIATANRQA